MREVTDRIDQAGVETKQLRRQIGSKVKERAKLQLQIADIEMAQEEDERMKVYIVVNRMNMNTLPVKLSGIVIVSCRNLLEKIWMN